MSDQSNFIAQIQEKEKEAAKTLEKVEKENNHRVLAAKEGSNQVIVKVEDATKAKGQERFKKTKEKAKEEYKRILIEEDNRRRDVIEGGKTNLDKAKKHIQEAFAGLFS